MYLVRLKNISHEFFWVCVGQAVAALGTLIGLRLLTGYLGSSMFGELALGLTFGSLLNLAIFSGPGLASLRFYSSALESKQFNSYFIASWRMIIQRIWILAVSVAILFTVAWFLGYGKWLSIAIASTFGALFTAVSTILDGIQNAARQRIVVAFHNGLGQWAKFVFAILLFSLFGINSSVAMWGFALASCLIMVSQGLFFHSFRSNRLGVQLEVTKADIKCWQVQLSNYAWPIAFIGVFGWLQTSSERWALQAFTNTSVVGLYAALSQVGYGPMILASNVIAQLFGPVLFNRVGDGIDVKRVKSGHKTNQLILFIFVIITLIAVGIAYLFHGLLFSIMVAPEFRSVSHLLPFMVLSGGLLGCSQIALYYYLGTTQTKTLLKPKIITAIISIIFFLCGAYLAGLKGIVFASVLSSAIYLFTLLYFYKISVSRVAS